MRQLIPVSLTCVLSLSIAVVAQAPNIPPGPDVLVFGGDYHLRDCPRLAGQSPRTMPLGDAMRTRAGPCRVCNPNDDKAIRTYAITYAVAIGRELEAVKAAEAAKEAAAARSRAEAERKRKEAEPLIRITESQARALVTEAAARAKNDADTFVASFLSATKKSAPDYKGPLPLLQSEALSIWITGPVGLLFAEARERVRKFEPMVPGPTWSPAIHILIEPQQIDAPDIEKVVVQRNGQTVPPLRSALVLKEMVTRIGAKRMIHQGEVAYPLAAFEPGPSVEVVVIAVPASGSNITRRFGPLDLRAIQ